MKKFQYLDKAYWGTDGIWGTLFPRLELTKNKLKGTLSSRVKRILGKQSLKCERNRRRKLPAVHLSWQKLSARTSFLKDRRLSASFKKGGFDALVAQARAPSATSRPPSNSYWLPGMDSNHDTQIQSLRSYH